MHSDVLIDECQPQAPFAPAAPAGADATSEALEDQRPLVDRDAGAMVLDSVPHVRQRHRVRVSVATSTRRLAAAIGQRIVEQVGDDPGEPASITEDDGPLGRPSEVTVVDGAELTATA